MKYYRFMSLKEFQKLTSGTSIVGSHTTDTCHTTSRGVCFLGDETKDDPDWNPIWNLEWLDGIVCTEVLVEIETDREFTKSKGQYADGWTGTCWREEYCTPSYSLDDCTSIRYAIPTRNKFWMWKNPEWYEYHIA